MYVVENMCVYIEKRQALPLKVDRGMKKKQDSRMLISNESRQKSLALTIWMEWSGMEIKNAEKKIRLIFTLHTHLFGMILFYMFDWIVDLSRANSMEILHHHCYCFVFCCSRFFLCTLAFVASLLFYIFCLFGSPFIPSSSFIPFSVQISYEQNKN